MKINNMYYRNFEIKSSIKDYYLVFYFEVFNKEIENIELSESDIKKLTDKDYSFYLELTKYLEKVFDDNINYTYRQYFLNEIYAIKDFLNYIKRDDANLIFEVFNVSK